MLGMCICIYNIMFRHVIVHLYLHLDGPIPSDAPVFTSQPPLTVFAIEGQDLVMECTKGIRNITKAVRYVEQHTHVHIDKVFNSETVLHVNCSASFLLLHVIYKTESVEKVSQSTVHV